MPCAPRQALTRRLPARRARASSRAPKEVRASCAARRAPGAKAERAGADVRRPHQPDPGTSREPLPTMTVVRLARRTSYTILDGVEELVSLHLLPLAAIVFTASFVVPFLKLGAIHGMLEATRRRSASFLRTRTRLFRIVRLIGRWSMIDIFCSRPSSGRCVWASSRRCSPARERLPSRASLFSTMLATETFDPRGMWDAALERDALRAPRAFRLRVPELAAEVTNAQHPRPSESEAPPAFDDGQDNGTRRPSTGTCPARLFAGRRGSRASRCLVSPLCRARPRLPRAHVLHEEQYVIGTSKNKKQKQKKKKKKKKNYCQLPIVRDDAPDHRDMALAIQPRGFVYLGAGISARNRKEARRRQAGCQDR